MPFSGCQENCFRMRMYLNPYQKLSPASVLIVSCGAGNSSFCSLVTEKQIFKWLNEEMWGKALPYIFFKKSEIGAVISHLLFLNVAIKEPKKLCLLLASKFLYHLQKWNGSWERRWCNSFRVIGLHDLRLLFILFIYFMWKRKRDLKLLIVPNYN